LPPFGSTGVIGDERVVRGLGWLENTVSFVRLRQRGSGFRIALELRDYGVEIERDKLVDILCVLDVVSQCSEVD